jgi:hypothetical protein
MRSRGVEFEDYDTPETRTEGGIAHMPSGGEGAWFKDSEGNLIGVVPANNGPQTAHATRGEDVQP